MIRDALRSGFMPTINAMAAMGLVALPGMTFNVNAGLPSARQLAVAAPQTMQNGV